MLMQRNRLLSPGVLLLRTLPTAVLQVKDFTNHQTLRPALPMVPVLSVHQSVTTLSRGWVLRRNKEEYVARRQIQVVDF